MTIEGFYIFESVNHANAVIIQTGMQANCLATAASRLVVVSRHGLAIGFPLGDDFVSLASGVKHFQLTLDHRDDGFTARSQIFTGVKFSRVGGEDFTDLGGQSQTQVGVDVDFADTILADSHGDLVFRNTLGVGHVAAVLVDQVDEFLGNGA